MFSSSALRPKQRLIINKLPILARSWFKHAVLGQPCSTLSPFWPGIRRHAGDRSQDQGAKLNLVLLDGTRLRLEITEGRLRHRAGSYNDTWLHHQPAAEGYDSSW